MPFTGHADNPSFRYDFEADCGVKPFGDFDFPGACSSHHFSRFWAPVATVSKNAFDEGEQTARASAEHQCNAVAVLNVGGVNDNIQQQTERIDEDMAFAARNLLARIEALRIEGRAPF